MWVATAFLLSYISLRKKFVCACEWVGVCVLGSAISESWFIHEILHIVTYILVVGSLKDIAVLDTANATFSLQVLLNTVKREEKINNLLT